MKIQGMNAGALMLLSLAALTGCMSLPAGLSTPTHFYRLETTSRSDGVTNNMAPSPARVLVKVQTTDSLRGRLLIVARSDYELSYQDTQRWAEPLSHGLSRLLAGALRPYYAAVENAPTSSGFSPDYRVEVTVDKLWGTAKGEVVFSARWIISDTHDTPLGFGHKELSQKGWDVGDYKDLAKRISRMSEEMGSAINESIAAAAKK